MSCNALALVVNPAQVWKRRADPLSSQPAYSTVPKFHQASGSRLVTQCRQVTRRE